MPSKAVQMPTVLNLAPSYCNRLNERVRGDLGMLLVEKQQLEVHWEKTTNNGPPWGEWTCNRLPA